MAKSIVISTDELADFFGSLSLSNSGGTYIYSGKGYVGEEVGEQDLLKGLVANDQVFASYSVPVDKITVDELFLTETSIGQILNHSDLIAERLEPEEPEGGAEDEEGDEDFGLYVSINFEKQGNGDLRVTVNPHTGDADEDAKYGGFFTQEAEETITESFPAASVARIISGEGMDESPKFVDREANADGEMQAVPDGPVSVWDASAKGPLNQVLKIARSFKEPMALERRHASRIYGVRIGERWLGAVSPIPLNKADLSDQGIFVDTTSLCADYDFRGLREEDTEEFLEPTQEADEPEEEDVEESEGPEAEEESEEDEGEYDEDSEEGPEEESEDGEDLGFATEDDIEAMALAEADE